MRAMCAKLNIASSTSFAHIAYIALNAPHARIHHR